MSSNRSDPLSRRLFLAGTVSASAVLASSLQAAEPTKPKVGKKNKVNVGLQLYSVREDCGKNLPATLAAVSKIGYAGVEFAGYYNYSATDMRKLLNDNGLVCCGTHTGLDTLMGDNLAKTIEYNKTIGNKYLIVPSLPDQNRNSIDAWKKTAALFNELADKVKPHGMRVGYHNHSVEFQPMDGLIPWDVFLQNTHPEVIMQLDTCNAGHGGADPLPYLYRYPGRATTVHVKAYSSKDDKALIGEDEINWKAYFALCQAVGETDWYIIEHESYAYPPIECVKRCFDSLKKMKLI